MTYAVGDVVRRRASSPEHNHHYGLLGTVEDTKGPSEISRYGIRWADTGKFSRPSLINITAATDPTDEEEVILMRWRFAQ